MDAQREARMNFDQAFDRLLGHEGGYSNNPADPGGETMWGVTAGVARANGYAGSMRDMPRSAAKSIYRKLYWESVKAEQLPAELRFDVFDGAVNSGVRQSVRWLQRAAGMPEREVDGLVGPSTMQAVQTVNPAVVASRYNGIRLRFMTDQDAWPTFGKGWARRIAANLQGLGA